MRVLLRAPLLTNSGYGVHSRQIFEWLSQRKDIDLTVECLNWGITSWLINPDLNEGLVGKIMLCSKNLEPPYDVAIQVQLPDEWDTSLGHKNIGISAFVETDRCNKAWVEKCNSMDHIIVPSTFTKNVVKRTGGLIKPITVIPEWYNHDILNKDECITMATNPDDNRYNFCTNFNFLIISQLTSANPDDDRKNLFNAIKWLCEAFKDDEEVGIVIKTNMGKSTTIDRALTTQTMKSILESIDRKIFPKIYLLHGNMTSKEMASLYHHPKINCFVSPTRGEGYGLPLIDAAVSGMPIVATNWSGHLEFLRRDGFYPVNYDMKAINESKIDDRIFQKGFRWAEPQKKSFIRQVLNVYYSIEESKAKVIKDATRIKKEFNKNIIMKMYDKILELI